jgi:type VI protein secretion system component Hcp
MRHLLRAITLGSLLLASLAALPSAASATSLIFVKFDELDPCGTSTIEGHQGEIMAVALSQDFERRADVRGLPLGVPNRAIKLVKTPDGCSALLFFGAVTGRHLTMHATFQRQGGTSLDYAQTDASDVVITSILMESDQAGDLQEVVTLGIGGILNFTVRVQSPTGQVETTTRCWNFATNRAC